MRHRVESPEHMQAWGERLAVQVQAGDLIILSGPLGAGKTTLTQGLARGLAVAERVTSPTFVIAHEHRSGVVPLVHVDAYRLGGWGELADLDLPIDESVTVVEWGAGIAERLAESHLLVEISVGGDEERVLDCTGVGDRWPSGRWPC